MEAGLPVDPPSPSMVVSHPIEGERMRCGSHGRGIVFDSEHEVVVGFIPPRKCRIRRWLMPKRNIR